MDAALAFAAAPCRGRTGGRAIAGILHVADRILDKPAQIGGDPVQVRQQWHRTSQGIVDGLGINQGVVGIKSSPIDCLIAIGS